jgi:hypothetical protein
VGEPLFHERRTPFLRVGHSEVMLHVTGQDGWTLVVAGRISHISEESRIGALPAKEREGGANGTRWGA